MDHKVNRETNRTSGDADRYPGDEDTATAPFFSTIMYGSTAKGDGRHKLSSADHGIFSFVLILQRPGKASESSGSRETHTISMRQLCYYLDISRAHASERVGLKKRPLEILMISRIVSR